MLQTYWNLEGTGFPILEWDPQVTFGAAQVIQTLMANHEAGIHVRSPCGRVRRTPRGFLLVGLGRQRGHTMAAATYARDRPERLFTYLGMNRDMTLHVRRTYGPFSNMSFHSALTPRSTGAFQGVDFQDRTLIIDITLQQLPRLDWSSFYGLDPNKVFILVSDLPGDGPVREVNAPLLQVFRSYA
jgi:hypothetical protein